MDTHKTEPALPFRSHTFLGVCEGIGEDFGFNPTYLRVPLAATVLWSLEYAVIAYLALGAIVLVSRLVFPQTKLVQAPESGSTRTAANEADCGEFPLAA